MVLRIKNAVKEGDLMRGTPLIEVRNVTKLFQVGGSIFGEMKYVSAVGDASLSIGERGVLAVVGESGCGKTMLGKMTLALLMSRSEFKKHRSGATQELGDTELSEPANRFLCLRSLVKRVLWHATYIESYEAVSNVYWLLKP